MQVLPGFILALSWVHLQALRFCLQIVEAGESVRAEVSMLKLSLKDPVCTFILLGSPDVCGEALALDLRVLGLVLADIGRVRLASVRECPCFTARGTKACRLLPGVHAGTLSEFLIERNKETAGRAWLQMRAHIGPSPTLAIHAQLLLLSLCDLVHLSLQIWLLLLAEQQAEIVVLVFILLREVEFLLVAGCVTEAEVLGYGRFSGAGDHGQRRAQLLIKVLL